MGIPRLAPAVSRYSVRGPLGGESVVIDGPSLVFQVYSGCMSRKPPTNGFICHPSYSTLGRLVIGWLEELRKNNVTVRKIYFDGYLPPSKWSVRRERLARQSKRMEDLLDSHPNGSSKIPLDSFDGIKPDITVTQAFKYSEFDGLPRPPFMVPAVLDILRSCSRWGPLVQVVAGEADMFCADDVRTNGGTVVTGDSDLFITDLGVDGHVSFLSDVVASKPEDKFKGLVAKKFNLYNTNDRLGITKLGGLTYVAYTMEKGTPFSEALDRTLKRQHSLNSPKFQVFREGYSYKEYLRANHPVQKLLSDLDPRISEIIIQTLVLSRSGNLPLTHFTPETRSRGPEALSMFLPIMLERRDRKSTWSMSTLVRQLAYSILHLIAPHGAPGVIEHRLIHSYSPIAGREVEILDSKDVPEQCTLLLKTLRQLSKSIKRKDLLWLSFTIYQDIVWSNEEGRPPVSASLIQNAKNPPNHHTWDIIHFTSQVQASLYSLRMIKQAVDVAVSLQKKPSKPMLKLRKRLDTLPPITEWPTVDNMPQLLSTINDANILTIITDMLGMPAFEETPAESKNEKKRKQSKDEGEQEPDTKRKASSNPFALLEEVEQ